MLDVGDLGEVGIMVRIYEVDVVRRPTHHEYCHHHCKHLHKLVKKGGNMNLDNSVFCNSGDQTHIISPFTHKLAKKVWGI